MSVAEAKSAHLKAFCQSLRDNDCVTPLEADDRLNDSNRDLISAMAEEHGAVWLGKVNLYNEDDRAEPMWKWDGDLVYNFGASFVIPCFDLELLRLIQYRDSTPYHGTADDYEWVNAIHARIEELGGHHFVWS